MKWNNAVLIFFASFILAIVFVGTAVSTIQVKSLYLDVKNNYKLIDNLRTESKRLHIEYSILTNPLDLLEKIELSELKSVPIKSIKTIKIEGTE